MVNWDVKDPEFEQCDGCELCIVPCFDCSGYGFIHGEPCEACDGDGQVFDIAEHQVDDEDEEYERW